MAKDVVCRWIAAAMALGLMIGVAAAAGQEGAGSPSGRATTASASPAALPEAMVPPVRRVRPKSPPGRLAVPKAKAAALHKGSAMVRRGALARVAANAACARGAAVNRNRRRCERKNGAETGRRQERGAWFNASAAIRKR
jgi:hypothetical protein